MSSSEKDKAAEKAEKAEKEKAEKEQKEKEKAEKAEKEKAEKAEKEKAEKDKKKAKEKEKTFNDLAPEYQWNPSLDPDHIFDGERELIKQLKKDLPSLENESDKFVLVFLLARRHDYKDSLDLLKKFIKLQTDYGFTPSYPPSFSHHPNLIPLSKSLEIPMMLAIGERDKYDRMLRYFFMGQDNPDSRDRKTTYCLMFWETYFLVNVEPLSVWRNGISIVVDFKGFGWKNIDMSSKGRAVNRDVQGTFPFRFRSFYCVNGGSVVGALVQAAKLVVPKKIMSRVNWIDQTLLKESIPSKSLLKRYDGGESDLYFDNWIVKVREIEESLFQKGIWKLKETNGGTENGNGLSDSVTTTTSTTSSSSSSVSNSPSEPEPRTPRGGSGNDDESHDHDEEDSEDDE